MNYADTTSHWFREYLVYIDKALGLQIARRGKENLFDKLTKHLFESWLKKDIKAIAIFKEYNFLGCISASEELHFDQGIVDEMRKYNPELLFDPLIRYEDGDTMFMILTEIGKDVPDWLIHDLEIKNNKGFSVRDSKNFNLEDYALKVSGRTDKISKCIEVYKFLTNFEE